MLSAARFGSRLSSRSLSKASGSLQVRHGISTRSTRISLLEPLSTSRFPSHSLPKVTVQGVLQQVRLNSSTTTSSSETAGRNVERATNQSQESIDNEEPQYEMDSEEQQVEVLQDVEELLAELKALWPRVESPSPNWSSNWDKWENLFSYFGPSPYYLHLPQMEMLVNIAHAIEGDVIPILYSTEDDSLIFVVQLDDERSSNLLLFDANAQAISSLPASGIKELAELMNEHGSKVSELPKDVIETDPDGMEVVAALASGDKDVLPFVDQYLSFSLRERGAITEEEADEMEEEQRKIMGLQDEIEEAEAMTVAELEEIESLKRELVEEGDMTPEELEAIEKSFKGESKETPRRGQ